MKQVLTILRAFAVSVLVALMVFVLGMMFADGVIYELHDSGLCTPQGQK